MFYYYYLLSSSGAEFGLASAQGFYIHTYEYTQLPTYIIASINSAKRFFCKYYLISHSDNPKAFRKFLPKLPDQYVGYYIINNAVSFSGLEFF